MADQPINPTGDPTPANTSAPMTVTPLRMKGAGPSGDPYAVITSSNKHWHYLYECTGDGVPPCRRRKATSGPLDDEANYIFKFDPCSDPTIVKNRIDCSKYRKIVITPTDRYWQPDQNQSPRVYERKDGNSAFERVEAEAV